MILERYIHREVLEKLLWLMGLLLLIITSHEFIAYLADAANGRIPGDLIIRFLIMSVIAVFPRVLPAAMFFAVILALTRLSSDKELLIMSGAGVSGMHQLAYVFKFAFSFAIFVFFVVNFVSPWAVGKEDQLKIRARQESDISGISAGRFKEFSRGDRVVYVQDLSPDRKVMHKVFLQVHEENRFGVLSSNSARFHQDKDTNSRYVMFENGHRYLGKPGKLDYQITDFRKYAVLLDQGKIVASKRDPRTVHSFDLFKSDDPGWKAELQWRASFVIATLILPLLAVMLNKLSFGDNRYVLMIIGIFTYFIYSNLISISKTLVAREIIPPYIGVWWVHIIMLLVFSMLFRRHFSARVRTRRVASQPGPGYE